MEYGELNYYKFLFKKRIIGMQPNDCTGFKALVKKTTTISE